MQPQKAEGDYGGCKISRSILFNPLPCLLEANSEQILLTFLHYFLLVAKIKMYFQNLTSDPSIAKRAIQKAAEEKVRY